MSLRASTTVLLAACTISILLGCSTNATNDVAPEPASCEAMADNIAAQCPDEAPRRLSNVLRCEDDRRRDEPLGCGRESAAYVRCVSESDFDCEQGPTECESALASRRACAQRFAMRTGCSRSEARDPIECPSADRYAFLCFGSAPDGCEPASTQGVVCCESFATSASSFVDPQLDPDELPPDYSSIDFDAPDQCSSFADERGWGRCEESVGCACAHCSAELAACASEHSCLFIRGCDLGTSTCSPDEDPYFTGFGGGAHKADTVEQCMRDAGCAAKCS